MKYRKLAELKKLDHNPRTISKDDMAKLVKSIKALKVYFEARPLILSNRTGELVILGGNQRYEAAKIAGFSDVPTHLIEGLTEAQEKEITIRDNVANGAWDWDILANEWETKDLDEWGVRLPDGFNDQEVVEDEPPPVSQENPKSKLGAIYNLGSHKLMCGDVTGNDIEVLMPGVKAKMVFTDPPYNIGYEGSANARREKIKNDDMSSEDFLEFLDKTTKTLLDHTEEAFYICMSSSELHTLWKAFTDNGGHWQTYIIWAKNKFNLSGADYQHQFEPIMYGLDEKTINQSLAEEDESKLPIMYGWNKHFWYGGRKQGDVWRFDKPNISKEHPTMKPISLCAKAIQNSSRKGEIVLDTFGGSGSTLIACEQTGRICYMMELDEKYCDVIRKRYWKFTHEGEEEGWEDGTR